MTILGWPSLLTANIRGQQDTILKNYANTIKLISTSRICSKVAQSIYRGDQSLR